MFERYTETARRIIFFARYEASQFGASYIETEHLMLGLFREDKALANQLLASYRKLEAIRYSITLRRTPGSKVSTSVDLPLSAESKRVLAYAAEEVDRLKHKYVSTAHLLLGLLREEKSFGASACCANKALPWTLVREEAKQSEPPTMQGPAPVSSRVFVNQWLAERQAPGSMWTVKRLHIANRITHLPPLYASDPPKESEKDEDVVPAHKAAQIQKRIDLIAEAMENAIANHEFEKARFYSDEERKERENLRLSK